jgi:hypothetical protein
MQPVPHTSPSEATGNSHARVLTWQQADRLSPSEAVQCWLNHEPAALHAHEPEHHLEELALMTVSAEWLTRWQPISMHQAILSGATPDQVADAAGTNVRTAFERWQDWADRQRHFNFAGCSGVTGEEYEAVRSCFAAASPGPLTRKGDR